MHDKRSESPTSSSRPRGQRRRPRFALDNPGAPQSKARNSKHLPPRTPRDLDVLIPPPARAGEPFADRFVRRSAHTSKLHAGKARGCAKSHYTCHETPLRRPPARHESSNYSRTGPSVNQFVPPHSVYLTLKRTKLAALRSLLPCSARSIVAPRLIPNSRALPPPLSV